MLGCLDPSPRLDRHLTRIRGGRVITAALTVAGATPEIEGPIPFPRRRVSIRARAAQRLAELYRLAAFSRQNGIFLDPDTWCFALAATLACGRPGRFHIARRQRTIRWHGLDMLTLREALRRCGLDNLSDDELATKITAVERWQAEHGTHLISSAKLGHMLSLSSVERTECRIRTIDAVDEPRAERAARRAGERRRRDREAKRAKRGRLPRAIYEAAAVSKQKPWEAEGISRATWYRRRETGVSAHDISPTHRATHLSHERQAEPPALPASTPPLIQTANASAHLRRRVTMAVEASQSASAAAARRTDISARQGVGALP